MIDDIISQWHPASPIPEPYTRVWLHNISAPSGHFPQHLLFMDLRKWLIWLVGCWSFTSWPHLRSYQDSYWLVTVRTHGDFIALTLLGHQATSTMIRYPTQSHYPDTERSSLCHILLMLSTWLPEAKSIIFLSHWFDSTRLRIPRSMKTWDGCSTHSAIPSGLYCLWSYVNDWRDKNNKDCALRECLVRRN